MLLRRQLARIVPLALTCLVACDEPQPVDDGVAIDDEPDEEDDASTGEALVDDAYPARAPTDPAGTYDCDFTEDFEGPDGAPWPDPWYAVGGVQAAELRDGWGRLRPVISDYSLARMILPLDCQDFDASVTVMFTEVHTQAAALYVRHNAGYLQETLPRGRGYAVNAENFRDPPGLGLWRELGGTEQDMLPVAPLDVAPYVQYRMRIRVKQQTPETTLVQGKFWPLSQPEPAAWTTETLDQSGGLRKRSGTLALDAYTSLNEFVHGDDVYFDDLVVTQAFAEPGPPPPLGGP